MSKEKATVTSIRLGKATLARIKSRELRKRGLLEALAWVQDSILDKVCELLEENQEDLIIKTQIPA